jgi:undecaprenyl-diphosphatase
MATNSNIQARHQENVVRRNVFQDLRSIGFFARWPLIGLTMFLVGTLVFGALAYEVKTNAAFVQWDIATARTMHAYALNIPSALVEYLIFGFFVGREIVIAIGAILTFYFVYKHFWRELAMVLIGSGGGGLLWYFLSRYFDRPRPAVQMDLVLTDPSFPSGHTLSAIVCYGFLAYLLVPKMPSRFWKWFVVIMLTLVTAFVGVSRLLLGGHYVSDVMAGYALGIAWAGLVYTVMERFISEGARPGQERPAGRTSFPALRTPGLFKRWPILGFILVLVGGLSFAALGYNLLIHGPLSTLDQSLYETLIVKARAAPPRLDELMVFGFFVGKQVIMVIVTILSIYFLAQRLWRELAMLLISSAAGSFVWNFFVAYFSRPRPPIQTGLAVTSIPSFPSGHAMSAIIGYGFLAYLLFPRMPSRGWKWTLVIVTALIVLFDGYSRIFQGSHYLTDILAGYALGLAWAGLVYILIENIFIKKEELENVEKG